MTALRPGDHGADAGVCGREIVMGCDGGGTGMTADGYLPGDKQACGQARGNP